MSDEDGSDPATTMSEMTSDLPPRSGRLIVVSNRVVEPGGDHAGGLAHALSAALNRGGGSWIGWSGDTSESGRVHERTTGSTRLLTLDLPANLHFIIYYQYGGIIHF